MMMMVMLTKTLMMATTSTHCVHVHAQQLFEFAVVTDEEYLFAAGYRCGGGGYGGGSVCGGRSSSSGRSGGGRDCGGRG